MAETLVTIGYGTLLRRSNGASPPVYTTVGEVVSLSGFGEEAALIDATHFESPQARMEYIFGLSDGVEFTALCNFINDATQDAITGMIADHKARTRRDFQLAVSDGPTYTFTGLVRKWELGGLSPNEKKTISYTVKPTGDLTED